MSVLNISSGQISLGDIRSHLGASGPISIGDLQSGGTHYVEKENVAAISSSTSFYNSSNLNWTVFTQQNSTSSAAGGNPGGGTITTTTTQQIRTYNTEVSYSEFNSNNTSMTISNAVGGAMVQYPDLLNSFGITFTRGSLQSAGTYSAWADTLDSKGNVLFTIRTKEDKYSFTMANAYKSNGRTRMNPGTETSGGSTSFSNLYSFDDGVLLDTTLTASTNGSLIGYQDPPEVTGSIGSNTISSRDSLYNGMKITGIYKASTGAASLDLNYGGLNSPANTSSFLIRRIEVDGTGYDRSDSWVPNAVGTAAMEPYDIEASSVTGQGSGSYPRSLTQTGPDGTQARTVSFNNQASYSITNGTSFQVNYTASGFPTTVTSASARKVISGRSYGSTTGTNIVSNSVSATFTVKFNGVTHGPFAYGASSGVQGGTWSGGTTAWTASAGFVSQTAGTDWTNISASISGTTTPTVTMPTQYKSSSANYEREVSHEIPVATTILNSTGNHTIKLYS